jgi:ubiquinone/menaquinone biosynthesis C-methylase UbiE
MDWDTYWRGSRDRAAFAGEGVDHPIVSQFWQRVLPQYQQHGASLRLLDVASGNGAVIESVQSVFGEDGIHITCLDSSDWAIKSLVQRYPFVEGVVGDAREMPWPDRTFALATSQFGVEYAGIEAISEMARLVAKGGSLILLMHVRGGMIDTECASNFDSVTALRDIGFIPAAQKIFAEARTCLQSESPERSRADYDRAVAAMRPVFGELKSVLARYGDATAGGTLSTLYHEVDRIHSRIMYHDCDEVLQWLTTMDAELHAYSGRMQSMCEAAFDDGRYQGVVDSLRAQEFELLTTGQLRDPVSNEPVAWELVATRP